MQKIRYAQPDPTLPKPWRGLVDSATSILYFWNPETNVTTYVRPTTDPQPPQPDLDNHSDRRQIHGVADLSGCSDDNNNGDPSHQSPGVNRDTSSLMNDQKSVSAFETHGEDHGHKHESTELVKRKDTSEFPTPKKQKTTFPPSVVDATEGHVEESIMKPTKVSHSVDEEQQESDEVHKPNQMAKENRKMSGVEGEVPQLGNINGAELLQANRLETFEMNVISSICTTLVAKEMGNSLPEKMPIVCIDTNRELLSVADGRKGFGEEIIDRDSWTDQDGGPIIDNMSNDNVDCPMIDSTQIEANSNQIEANLEKQPIKQSLTPPIDKVEEDLTLTESIDRLAGVTDQLFGTMEAMRYVIQYAVSAKEIDVQLRCENEELKKNVADLKKKVADLEAKSKETDG